jgi:hypothetical protein
VGRRVEEPVAMVIKKEPSLPPGLAPDRRQQTVPGIISVLMMPPLYNRPVPSFWIQRHQGLMTRRGRGKYQSVAPFTIKPCVPADGKAGQTGRNCLPPFPSLVYRLAIAQHDCVAFAFAFVLENTWTLRFPPLSCPAAGDGRCAPQQCIAPPPPPSSSSVGGPTWLIAARSPRHGAGPPSAAPPRHRCLRP